MTLLKHMLSEKSYKSTTKWQKSRWL